MWATELDTDFSKLIRIIFLFCRLSKAYEPASKYMNLFVSPFMAIIAK